MTEGDAPSEQNSLPASPLSPEDRIAEEIRGRQRERRVHTGNLLREQAEAELGEVRVQRVESRTLPAQQFICQRCHHQNHPQEVSFWFVWSRIEPPRDRPPTDAITSWRRDRNPESGGSGVQLFRLQRAVATIQPCLAFNRRQSPPTPPSPPMMQATPSPPPSPPPPPPPDQPWEE